MKTFKQFLKEQEDRSVLAVIWSFYWRLMGVIILMWFAMFIMFIALLSVTGI